MKTSVVKKLEDALALKKTADIAVEKSGVKINRLVGALVNDLQKIKVSESVDSNIEAYESILNIIDKYQSSIDKTISTYDKFEDIQEVFEKMEV